MNINKNDPGIHSNARIRLVYILAASHSGSTLLSMVLGSHPQIATVGELKFTAMGNIDRYRCSCHEEIRKCSFWNDIVMDMDKRGFVFDLKNAGTDFQSAGNGYTRYLLHPLHRGPFLEALRDAGLSLSFVWRKEYEKIQSKNLALLDSIAKRLGKRIIVDSSKLAVRLKYLLRNSAIDVRVVRLIRDGRAVALTYTDSARFADASERDLRGGGMGIMRDYKRLPMREAAMEWRRSNEEEESLLATIDPSLSIEVRYEDFCKQPSVALNRIFNFLDVAPVDVITAFRNTVQHVVGNGMRLNSNREIRFDEQWREILTKKDLEVFESVAGDLNRRLGYI